MSNLLTQLSQLQTALADIGEKYRATQKELYQLKNRPLVDKTELEQANEQLTLALERNNYLEQQRIQQDQAYQALEKQLHEAFESYHIKELELEKANQTIHQLSEKNRIASERAKKVLENLSKIDKDNDNDA